MKYQERIIAFIDVLGFREFILNTSEHPSEVTKLYETFLFLKDLNRANGTLGTVRTVSQFSDLFVISFEPDKNFFHLLLKDIDNLIKLLLKNKLLCRGIIIEGQLLHYEGIIFGPGLVEAYEAERDRVIQPRIIIVESVQEFFPSNPLIPQVKDSDDENFLNYFSKHVFFHQILTQYE